MTLLSRPTSLAPVGPLASGGAMQPYAHVKSTPGEPTNDPITKVLYKIGQIGPRAQEHYMMTHGRYLAGMGGLNETQQPWDPEYRSDFMHALEREDDVNGSGIFDSYGRQGTLNPDMGVFADHPSMPGYIDREVQYQVSSDIRDINAGADFVAVPGGGMPYIERGGRAVAPTVAGRRLIPTPTNVPGMTLRMALPSSGLLPAKGIPSASQQVQVALKQLSSKLAAGPQQVLGQRSIVNTAVAERGVSGFGAEEEKKPAGLGAWLFAGLLVGGAAAMVVGVTRIKVR